MKKIIIVEDEFRIRNGLSTLINKLDMGCKVIGEAENGFEGLKMISDMEPEVVITDIKMPKMDGLSMIRQAKEMGASCDFVILSGYAEFEYAQQGIQLGVMDYLLKPASVSDVKELLNKLNEEKEITQGLDRENCSDIVREMINVIEESYGMKLQLDAIAEKFHMTPEYLGNLFAKETGITFSNYLRQVRMEKAKELLAEAGYPDGFTMELVVRDDDTLRTAQILQNNFAQINVTVDIKQLEYATYTETCADGRAQAYLGSHANAGDTDNSLRPLFYSTKEQGTKNWHKYSNPEVDAKIDEANQTSDASKREELYKELQTILVDECPIIPIYSQTINIGVRKGIAGVYPIPHGINHYENAHYE